MIGACIAKSERLDDVLPIIQTGDFYDPRHQVLFAAIVRLLDAHDIVDAVSLASTLQSAGELEAAGGTSYLASLIQIFPFSANVLAWAQTVRDAAKRRRVMHATVELFQSAADPASNISDVSASLADLVDGVLADKLDTGRQTPAQIEADYRQWLDLAVDDRAGVPLPFGKAQRMTGGFLPGEMIVLAARPSNGKTALALNMCLYALGQGGRVGIVSLEMRSRALMSRLCSMALNIDAQKFRNRTLSVQDREKILGFCQRFRNISVRMWDEPEFSPARMRAVVKSWKRQMGGLDFLVVDYLQLMGSDHVDGRMSYNREQEVARISKAIKRLALAEDVPVMVLAQLNRQAEKDSKPMLSHLRESGSLEQDADFVLFLSFWDPRQAGTEVLVDLDIAKGRSSQTGSVPLVFHRPFLRFEERVEDGWS